MGSLWGGPANNLRRDGDTIPTVNPIPSHPWAVKGHFSVYQAIFGIVMTNNQPKPRTSLFLTSETAVSCNIIESNQPITDESKSESERGQFEIPLDRTNLFLAPT